MSNKTVIFLLSIVIAAMAVLFLLNLPVFQKTMETDKFISRNNIRGMAVERKGKRYTLNFEQQNKAASILNRSIKIGLEGYLEGEETTFDYDALIIFRFNGKDIEVKPVSFTNQQLIFQAKELNPDGLLRETGPGELDPLLNQTYDTKQE